VRRAGRFPEVSNPRNESCVRNSLTRSRRTPVVVSLETLGCEKLSNANDRFVAVLFGCEWGGRCVGDGDGDGVGIRVWYAEFICTGATFVAVAVDADICSRLSMDSAVEDVLCLTEIDGMDCETAAADAEFRWRDVIVGEAISLPTELRDWPMGWLESTMA